MAFPGAKPQRTLYTQAQRVRDNLGKGQEVLRSFSISMVGGGTRKVMYIPEVDIILVDVAIVGEQLDSGDTFELLAPAAFDTAAGSGNRLIAQVVDTSGQVPDDSVIHPALLGLNGNKVVAGQPVMAEFTADAGLDLYCQVSYILADGAVSY